MQAKNPQASTPPPLRVFKIDASGRFDGSATRALTADLVSALGARYGQVEVSARDLANGVPFVDDAWINANFTPEEDRTAEQRRTLGESDALVEELQAADVLVVGMPIYNFGVPAVLKAWVDMVARARKTFRYTDNGPLGLLQNKKAYLVVASGGVPVEGATDFATPYMRHALGFLGIKDIAVIAAEQLNHRQAASMDAARMHIAELVHTNVRSAPGQRLRDSLSS